VIKIAITGNFGVGKSFVSSLFKDLGVCVYDADAIIHELYENDEKLKRDVVKLLGEDILKNGNIDRKKVADIVFNDKQKLLSLEKIVHKALYEYLDNLMKNLDCDMFALEASLIVENGTYKDYDIVIVVYADKETSKKRLIKKGYTEEQIEKRLSRQMPIEEKIKYADFVIDNTDGKEFTMKQVKNIYNKIRYAKILGMEKWKEHLDKLKRLEEFLNSSFDQIETIVELCMPGNDCCPDCKRPLVLIKFCLEDNKCHERRIELFDHYFDLPDQELFDQITHYVEDFMMEIEQSEYGGG
jgi:dephospho-CoA kinase